LKNNDDSYESGNIKVDSNKKCYFKGVIIYNKSLIQAISAKVIIDATGDGLVSQCAGAKVLDIKDPLYPELLPPCFYIYMCEGKATPVNEKLCNTTKATPPNQIPDYKILEEPDGRICLKVKGIPGEFDYGCGKDFSEAERTAKNLIPDILDDVWRKGYKNKVFNYYPGMIGIREGRRIEGDYILTINDVRENRVFPDSVAYCEFTVDTGVFHEVVPGFQIPYRSLIVKNTGNLLVAGRCFSADRLTMSAARIMITCCMMGQAAGYAAAEACRNNMDIREINTRHIRKMLTDGSEDSETMMMKLEKGVF
ncbi:MAG: FAD-dependent oxidoreductase, partial [Eubacteriales bacterium]|nr:FAD-dependent oxidoreductase [Eubacteriales bacterium]